MIVKKVNQEILWVVPFTSKIVNNDYRITTGSTGVESQLVLSQFRSISSNRLLRKASTLKFLVFYQVLIKLAFILLGVLKDETPP